MDRVYGVDCRIYGDSHLLVGINCDLYLGFFFLYFLGDLVELLFTELSSASILITLFAMVSHSLNQALEHGLCKFEWVALPCLHDLI